ncbi:hybrid sensor histidine kinase/response regulator [Sneathiella chinensis]|uniref:histidine kinase n=1 Tax=Sneathiella chinensis TaxID=349750 RepID=A0ABQ5U1P1_9PROT|nr:PAS domain-containing sensor histidine kinase [Sneathiella chinensis]GLQ06090.1 hypothetical protein GCM10007924_13110 [Sneathiella chinensis]
MDVEVVQQDPVFRALDTMSDAMTVFNRNGALIYFNNSLLKLYGFTGDQVRLGMLFADLLELVEAQEAPQATGAAEGGGTSQMPYPDFSDRKDWEFEIPLADGRWVRCAGSWTEEELLICFQKDITAQVLEDRERNRLHALYRAAFDANNHLGSITVLETGKFIDVNDGWCQKSGYRREEAIGKTALELNIWASPAERERLVAALQATSKLDHFPMVMRTRQGELRNIVLNTEVISVGGVRCLFLSAIDVTDSLEMRRAFEITENRVRAIFDNAPIGMALYNQALSRVVVANDEYYRVLGRSPAELEHLGWRGITHPDDLVRDGTYYDRLIRAEIPGYETEKRFVHPDGAVVWVNVSVVGIEPGKDGMFTHHLVMVTDITEKKKTAVALEAVQDRLRDFTSVSADWYWEIDHEGRLAYLSIQDSEGGETQPEQYAGQDVFEILQRQSDDQESLQLYSEKVANREAFRDLSHFRIDPQTGQKQWIRTSGKPFYDSQGGYLGFRGSATDVTEQVELEEKLIQAQKMEAVGQLTGGIAHDFNNLLAVIQGNAEIVRENLEQGGEVSLAQVDTIIRAVMRGAELTQSMLAFSRKQNLRPRAFDVRPCIEGMAVILRRVLGEAVEVKTAFDDGLWDCLADQGKVENALLNLSINARDAMPEGGVLTLEARNAVLDNGDAARLRDLKPGDYVVLTVRDTGVGMTPEQLEHVFEPFYTTKEIGKGTGLGLSMVYGFARQSGGHVAIDSVPGRGTVVRLYLPVATPSA